MAILAIHELQMANRMQYMGNKQSIVTKSRQQTGCGDNMQATNSNPDKMWANKQ